MQGQEPNCAPHALPAVNCTSPVTPIPSNVALPRVSELVLATPSQKLVGQRRSGMGPLAARRSDDGIALCVPVGALEAMGVAQGGRPARLHPPRPEEREVVPHHAPRQRVDREGAAAEHRGDLENGGGRPPAENGVAWEGRGEANVGVRHCHSDNQGEC